MPLSSLAVALPAGVEAVSAGDVDGDGRDELILESRKKTDGAPDAVTLTVIAFGADGRPGAPRTWPLENRAGLWDAGDGLWWIDKSGLVRLDQASARVASFPSLVAALGPTTPRRARVAADLDGDGRSELLAWSAGRYLAFRADGTAFGSIPAASRGILDTGYALGGDEVTATVRPPPLVVGDVNGDGRQDLLLPRGTRATAFLTGATVGTESLSLPLPLDVDPPDDAPLREGETRRTVSGVWLQDLDGDKRLDLAVHRTVLDGSWFGATAELLYARGTGAGFGALQTVPISQAAFALRPVDADGDGKQEFLAALVDVGMGNLARALLTKEVQAQLALYRLGPSGYAATPTPIRTIRFPLEHPEALHVDLSKDLDGDRMVDLVTDDASDSLCIYRGGPAGFASSAAWCHSIRVPAGDQSLFVHDLTGDGRAEIVVWGQGEKTATVLRVP